jgi:hypothetical protein
MPRVRRLLPILLLVPALALVSVSCGGSKHAQDSKQAQANGLAAASASTIRAGTASFTLVIRGTVAGVSVRSSETGALSFTDRRAHFYKLVPGGGLPQEIVLDGPYTYTNANVDAALQDSSVKPWTKLDTRRLPASDSKSHPDELAHVRAVAYLADGVADPKRVGVETVDGQQVTHFRGLVDPARVATAAPAAERPALRTAVRNDYLAQPFAADFWLDDSGRVRRVLVDYRTSGGGRIVVDGVFSDFGTKVDLTVPSAEEIQDITP